MEKRIKQRIGIFVVYLAIGIILIVLGTIKNIYDSAYSVGIAMAVVGIVKIIQNVMLINNEDAMRDREIAEKDERNIMIYDRARSWAFSAYIIAAADAMVILYCMDMQNAAKWISYSICMLVLIYFICYHIARRKY